MATKLILFTDVRSTKIKWMLAGAILLAIAVSALLVITSIVKKRYEPYVRAAAIRYLQERFDSEVELGPLQIHMPQTSTPKLILTRGRGAIAEVEGSDLILRHMGRRDLPPMFAIKHFRFAVDLGLMFEPTKKVRFVQLDGMEIYVPPKGERPNFKSDAKADKQPEEHRDSVLIEEVLIRDAALVILPRDQSKIPLRFDLQRVRMESVAKHLAMSYDAELTNAKPPGAVHSTGTFGPWAAEKPSDTPLAGEYTFEKADLGVFQGIAGILNSRGQFEGTLDSVRVRGQANVPDFRLTAANNPVPLSASFDVVVDLSLIHI